MKAIKKIIMILTLVLVFIPFKANAEEANTVNLYLFYGNGCPHCAALEEALEEIKPKYPNLKVYSYEVWFSSGNASLLDKAADSLNKKVTGVPFAVIGTRTFSGYSEASTLSEIEYAIKVYSKSSSYKDPVGDIVGVESSNGSKTYEDLAKEYKMGDGANYSIDIPFIGRTDAATLSLPILAIVIGTIDGFNPCAMWVLLFLISALIGMKDKKRMWILGSTFIVTSAIIYLAFMLAWLNLAIFIGAISWVKMLIAAVALIGGFINIRSFLRTKEDGCEVVDEKKRKKIFSKIRAFTTEKKFFIAILGVIALAVSVNFVELLCSAGLPVIFTNVLALNNLSPMQYAIYIFIYLVFFLLDELVVFFIAMTSLQLKGISNKYGKWSHLIGGVIMIILGLLMIFKPDWLMLNF